MDVVFRGEKFGLRLIAAKVGQSTDYSRTVQALIWRGDDGAAALVSLNTLAPGLGYNREVPVSQQLLAPLIGLKGTTLDLGRESVLPAPLGHTVMRHFRSDARHCVAWRLMVSDTGWDRGAGNGVLIGYYCQAGQLSRDLPERLLKNLGFRGSYVPPGTPPGVVPQTDKRSVGRSPAKTYTAPFTAHWEGAKDVLQGTMSYVQAGGKGDIMASYGDVDCQGRWQWVAGEYGTEQLPHGTWSITCTDGRSASGTYLSSKPDQSEGQGVDSDGKQVRITVGTE